MIRSLFMILASVISNQIFSALLHNTAQPMARDFVRQSVKFTIRVVAISLIGALTVVAGIVVSGIDLGNQLVDTGGVYFSPRLWFGLGMIVLGAVLLYIGAYTNVLSPWRKSAKKDHEHVREDSNTLTCAIDRIAQAIQDRREREVVVRRETVMEPPPREPSRTPYTSPLH